MHPSKAVSVSNLRSLALDPRPPEEAPRGFTVAVRMLLSSSVSQESSVNIPSTTGLPSGPLQRPMAGRASRGFPVRGGTSRPLPIPPTPANSVSTNSEQAVVPRLFIGSSRQGHVPRPLPPPPQPIASSSSSTGPSTSDPDGTYYASFEEAYETNNPEAQIYNLEKMADLSIEKGDLIKAAHLLNGALAVALKSDATNSYQERLFSRLEGLEGLFLEKTFGKKAPTSHHHYLFKYRETLQNIRAEVGIRLTNQEPAEAIQYFFTENYQGLLCTLIEESIALIGETPPPFAVMGLGSLARMEACPYSDVEFAIVVADEKPKTLAYFRNLCRFLELKVTNLGETKLMIVRPKRVNGIMREGTSLTIGGFSMDIGGLSPLGKTGVYELIGSPQKLAAFQDPAWFQRNEGELILVNAMACVSRIYGDETLVQKYTEEMQRWLGMEKKSKFKLFSKGKKAALPHQTRARVLLEGHVAEFHPYLSDDRVDLRAFNVKKDLYRPLQMAINGLILFYGFSNQGCLAGIEMLRQKKIFSEEGAKNLAQALRSVLALRMQTHLFYKKEEEFIYRSRGEGDQEGIGLFQLPEDSKLIQEIYCVLIPLHETMQRFLGGDQQALANTSFYDSSVGTLSSLQKENLDYAAAESSYLQAASFNPDNSEARNLLGQIKTTRGKLKEALKHHLETLQLFQKEYGDVPHPNIIIGLNNVGNSYNDLGNTESAIAYYEQSLAIAESLYGDEPDPLIAIILNNLGMVYRALGKTAEAISYSEKSLMIRKHIHRDDPHSDISTTLTTLGLAQMAAGNARQAIDYYYQSLAVLEKLHGTKPHPDIALTLGNMGLAYSHLKNTPKAMECYDKDLAMTRLIHGNIPHPQIAKSLNNLGNAWKTMKNPCKAIVYYEESLAINQKIYSDMPHPDLAGNLSNLGMCYGELKETDKAIDYLNQSVTMYKQIYGDVPRPEIAQALSNQGVAYTVKREFHRANLCFEFSLWINKEIFGERPLPDTAMTLNLQGLAYAASGVCDKAIPCFEQSIIMYKQIYGDKSHSDIASTLRNQGTLFILLGDTNKAIACFKESLAMYIQTEGINDPVTKQVEASLKMLQIQMQK